MCKTIGAAYAMETVARPAISVRLFGLLKLFCNAASCRHEGRVVFKLHIVEVSVCGRMFSVLQQLWRAWRTQYYSHPQRPSHSIAFSGM